MFRTHSRVIIVVLLILACACAHAAGPHGIQVGQPLNNGGQIILNDQMAQAIADSGAGWVRLSIRLGPYATDTPEWYAIYDGIIDRLRSRGIEVIGLVNDEAWRWISHADWTQNAYETNDGDKSGWNPYLNNLSQAFLRYATHWQGKVKYWELWNEPDCLAVIYPSNYGAYISHAYDLIHTNNIDAKIISGGLCTGGQSFGVTYLRNTYDVAINHTGWFTQMKTKWGTYPLDYIGYHCYPKPSGFLDKTEMGSLLDGIHQAYMDYEGSGTTKQIFLTELGWETAGVNGQVSESTQASNLTGAFDVVNSKPYVKCMTWFFLKDIPEANPGLYFGIYKSSGLSETDKKPAWSKFNRAVTYEGRWSAGGAIDQPILDYFNAQGHPAMGNPFDNGGTAWAHLWDYGPVQDYDGGTLGRLIAFNTANGDAHCVRGPFLPVILANHSTLEFPLADQTTNAGVDKQSFEGGYVTYTPTGGTSVTLYANKLPVDNSASGFGASASWASGTSSDSYLGGHRKRLATTTNSDPAVWTVSVPQAGCYDVYARWPNVVGATSTAAYEIVHSAGTATASVNHQARSNRWNRLGSYSFAAGNATVRLSSQGDASTYVVADAVRLVGPVPGAPTPPVVTDDGRYTTSLSQLHAIWSVADPANVEHYEYAIGTSPTDPGSGYLVGWTSTSGTPSVTKTVTLARGATYYFYVKAFNSAGVGQGASDGITPDNTAPTKPVVIDDGDYTGDNATLHCSWSASDPESGIARFDYFVGTGQFLSDIVPITNIGTATQVWVRNLSLTPGTTYYFGVRAQNGSGLFSSAASSDGIRYQPAVRCDSVAAARGLPDSSIVFLPNKTISAAFGGCFYLQDNDRSAGIAIGANPAYPEGSVVSVTGTLSTPAGERRITPGCVTPAEP